MVGSLPILQINKLLSDLFLDDVIYFRLMFTWLLWHTEAFLSKSLLLFERSDKIVKHEKNLNNKFIKMNFLFPRNGTYNFRRMDVFS